MCFGHEIACSFTLHVRLHFGHGAFACLHAIWSLCVCLFVCYLAIVIAFVCVCLAQVRLDYFGSSDVAGVVSCMNVGTLVHSLF